MTKILLALMLGVCCGCTQSTRQAQEVTVKEETRVGVEAGQPTKLKIVTHEKTQTQEQAKSGMDPEALQAVAASAASAVVSGLSGDVRGTLEAVRGLATAMSAAPKATPTDWPTLIGAGTAVATAAGYGVIKAKESKGHQERAFRYAEQIEPSKAKAGAKT